MAPTKTLWHDAWGGWRTGGGWLKRSWRQNSPNGNLLMQFQAFRVPRNLDIDSQTRDQLPRLSANFGLDPGQVLTEYEDWCPLATQFAMQIASATTSDVSLQAWQRTTKHVGKKACEKSSLLKLLHRFVAYIGSASKVERTFSQCMAQFRHLRNFGILGVQRTLVLAGTRGQSLEEDLALYARARQIWAENFGVPRQRRHCTIFSGKYLRRMSQKKVCGQTEAAARRRRALALASLPAQGKKTKKHAH